MHLRDLLDVNILMMTKTLYGFVFACRGLMLAATLATVRVFTAA